MKYWQPILLFTGILFAIYGTKGETNPTGQMLRDIEAIKAKKGQPTKAVVD
jgi:hypothetical protein